MANPIKGESGILFIKDTTYKPVACLTSNALQQTLSVIESQTKCFPGQIKKQAGILTYNISAEGEYIDTTTLGGDTAKQSHDALMIKQNSRTEVLWKIDTDINNATSTKYWGTAIITDLALTQAAGDAISTFSLTLDGSGLISLTEPV